MSVVVLRCLVTCALALTVAGPAAAARYTFVSAPDSWNADIGDIRPAPGWDPGEPNSINGSWRHATDVAIAQMALHQARFALIAGDLVNGHWYADVGHFETLGRINGFASKRLAIRRASAIYYRAIKQVYRRHRLPLHPALGDHELGDNPWRGQRRRLVPVFRRAWSDAFTHGRRGFVYLRHPPRGTQHARSAYAFRYGPVMFVTVDVFHQGARGRIVPTVAGSQLRWLKRVLHRANRARGIKFIVVQGHVPALRPRMAGYHSSEMNLRDGARSRFWRLLEGEHVDLYLAGEYHTIAPANLGGVEQLVHGSIFGIGAFSYLRVDVSARALRLALYRAPVRRIRPGKLWQLDHKRPFRSRIVGRFGVVGRMRITAAGRELDRSGLFQLRSHGPY